MFTEFGLPHDKYFMGNILETKMLYIRNLICNTLVISFQAVSVKSFDPIENLFVVHKLSTTGVCKPMHHFQMDLSIHITVNHNIEIIHQMVVQFSRLAFSPLGPNLPRPGV